MKILVVVSCLLGAGLCADLLRAMPAIRHEEVHDRNGQYHIRYLTPEGTLVTEQGKLVPTADGKDYVMEISGEYRYTAPDGQVITTQYGGGLDGFHAEADHLPKQSLLPESNE